MSGDPTLHHPGLAALLTGARRTLGAHASRRILKNVAALSIAQTATYILPLAVLPYTAAVLGPKFFGMIALTQAVVQYSVLITNYGFSFSATRQAALCQGDSKKLAEIVVHVWTAKCLLMLFCLAASAVAFASIPSLRFALGAYLCGFIAVVGNVLYLDWFFQAIEEMKWITLINVIPKLLLTPLIFPLVRAPSHYARVLLIQSATFLVSGLAGAALARHRLQVKLPAPTARGLVVILSDGWRTFLATLSINLYTTTNIVVLGVMTNVGVVGYYSAGQKVVTAMQSLWTPVSQSLYPHFCKSFQGAPGRASRELRRLTLAVLTVTLAACMAVCAAAPRAIPEYLGPKFAGSVGVIQVLVFSVCAVSTNTVLGLQGMLASGLNSSFLKIVGTAASANLILTPVAILAGGDIGLALCAVGVESAIGLQEYRILRRNQMI